MTVPSKIKGWKPELPDSRDYKYSLTRYALERKAALPTRVDLRHYFTFPVYNQGELGSCVANAIAANIRYDRVKQKLDAWDPSRLFIYWNARALDKCTKEDSGAYIRDGVKSLVKWGYCKEPSWKYDESKVFVSPPSTAYGEAYSHKALQYFRLNNTNISELKNCLAAGYPFVFGATLFESFMDGNDDGRVQMPKTNENPLGGHAMLCVGYDDEKGIFIIRNSWGDKVGDHGSYYIPYDYLTTNELADDFWTIRKIS